MGIWVCRRMVGMLKVVGGTFRSRFLTSGFGVRFATIRSVQRGESCFVSSSALPVLICGTDFLADVSF
jgi:hypothetical protein